MNALVADIGGTNTRFATVDLQEQGALSHIRSYPNDSFDGFETALGQYRADIGADFWTTACIAVAGPVSGPRARLTNRPDWTFDADVLCQRFNLTSLTMMNDLAALAEAVPVLGDGNLEHLAGQPVQGNQQAIVIGIGTGINVALSKTVGPENVVVAAELGHAAIPASFLPLLPESLCDTNLRIEDILSGRGLEMMYAYLAEGSRKAPKDIVAAFRTDPAATQAVRMTAEIMAEMVRQLVPAYFPQAGVFIAGSVARGVLDTPARAQFTAGLAPLFESPEIAKGCGPVHLITSDTAALLGLAARLQRPTA